MKSIAASDHSTGPRRERISQTAPRNLDSEGKFGVCRYENTDILLHFDARNLDLASREDPHERARAEVSRLEIALDDEPGGIELTVLWNGRPAAGRTIFARGPKGFQKNLKTDEKGDANLETKKPGRCFFEPSSWRTMPAATTASDST